MTGTELYDMGYDLVVDDEGVAEMSAILQQKLELYDAKLDEMVGIMEKINTDAIMQGNIANNLGMLNTKLRSLVGETEHLKERIKEELSLYLTEIEDADGRLYQDMGCIEMYGGEIVYVNGD